MEDQSAQRNKRRGAGPGPMSRFNNRLDPATFENDVEVDVVVVKAGAELDWSQILPEEQVLVPERIFDRLCRIGAAYELQRLQSLKADQPSRLNRSQTESLIEEVEFVASIVDDPALRHYIQPLLRVAELCLRSGKAYELIIEWP
jgi:hypothetical protein